MVINTKTKHFVTGASFILIFFVWNNICAQSLSPTEEYNKYAALYPNENAIITDYWRIYNVSIINDSLNITVEQYEETFILDNAATWVKDKVYSSSLVEVTELEAFTLIPNKKKYKRVEVEDFKRSYDKNTYVFFDDTELINYSYPEVSKGCKIVTKQKWKLNNPHLIGQFFISSYIPVVKAKVKISVDSNISIAHGIHNEELANVSFQTSKLGDGKIEYIYQSKDIKKVKIEESSPSFNHLTSSVYFNIESYNLRGETINVMSSLDDLHKWYYGFISDLEIDESVKELSNSIVNQTDSSLEKMRKIFYWVQSNIKYIAFEQGMRGFIPHDAGYVCQKKYGDCKDMSSILVGLLRSQNIPANYTWIGTRDLPYKYSETPSPNIDNHMIASVEMNNETFFLDATGNYIPLGYPTAMIQGKEALVSNNNSPKILEVPVVPKEKNLMIDSSYIKLDNGTIIGQSHLELSGLAKVANTYKLINKTSDGEENYLKRLLSKGSNKFFLDQYTTHHVEDLDKPIQVDYNFQIKDYYKSIGNETYINLCLDKSLTNDLIANRLTPRENDYKYINKSVTILEIPDGYTISYLPEKSAINSKHFGYSITYELVDNKLFASKEFYVDYLLMYPKDFSEWNETIKQYAQAVRTTVVLTKNVD